MSSEKLQLWAGSSTTEQRWYAGVSPRASATGMEKNLSLNTEICCSFHPMQESLFWGKGRLKFSLLKTLKPSAIVCAVFFGSRNVDKIGIGLSGL